MNRRTKAIAAVALIAGAGCIGLIAPTAALAHGPDRGGHYWMNHGGHGHHYRDGDGCYRLGARERGAGPMRPGWASRDREPLDPGMMGRGQGMMGRESDDDESDGLMGPGMMRQGMMAPGAMGFGWAGRVAQPFEKELTADDVRNMMEHRLNWMGNPNIKLGTVGQNADGSISAEIVTQDGSLVQKFAVDPRFGWIKPDGQ